MPLLQAFVDSRDAQVPMTPACCAATQAFIAEVHALPVFQAKDLQYFHALKAWFLFWPR